MKTFTKKLSANDVGATGAHQAGILVPKSDIDLLNFFPQLDGKIKNPDAWIHCIDEHGMTRKFRYIYYNNKAHDEDGTRNEYRITHMTTYFKSIGAKEGDIFEISKENGSDIYTIKVLVASVEKEEYPDDAPVRIKLKTSWKRVH
jgi:hypothetical protein